MHAFTALLAPVLALALAAVPAKSPAPRAPAPKQILPWIEDDYTRAVAEAKTRKLPIFVESWAPW